MAESDTSSWEKDVRDETWDYADMEEEWELDDRLMYEAERRCPPEPSSGEGCDGEGGSGKGSALGLGLGAALLLGASVGIGVGVSVAALATIATRHIQYQKTSWWSNHRRTTQGKPLSAEQWCGACSSDGTIDEADFLAVARTVSKGGVSPSIRVTVWPFLLKLVQPSSAAETRDAEFQTLRRRYANLVALCKSLQSELLEDAVHEIPRLQQAEEYRENKRIVNLDVVRTDFKSMAFINDANPDDRNGPSRSQLDRDAEELGVSDHVEASEYLSSEEKRLAKYMAKLLLCYSLHDPQTGYCQGMTDLIQPFVQVFEDEAICFWAFASFMKEARENFRTDEDGIMKQINAVKGVLATLRPELLEKLTAIGAGSCYFAYRMLLVYLRRELSLRDAMFLWEVMWAERILLKTSTGLPEQAMPGFMVFVVVSIILELESQIYRTCQAESDVVEIFCNTSFDVWEVVDNARYVREEWVAAMSEVMA